jgi:hypothetical protein
MRESPDKKIVAPDAGVEAVIHRESEEALSRFRSRDFASGLKARLDSPPARQPFFLFRKPVFVPALGVLVVAAAAIFLLLRTPSAENDSVEAGFRFMTKALGQSEYLKAGGGAASNGKTPARTEITPFAAALFRKAAELNASPEPAVPEKEGLPLRPLFNSRERFKILYGDKAILRVLTTITTEKEV